MATLTWRNVDGPDFGRSLQGLRQSSDMLGNAAGIWNDQIRAFAEQDKSAADLLAAQQRQAINAEALNQTQYLNQRTRTTNEGIDLASPVIREYITKMRAGDQVGAQALYANSPELARLQPDALIGLANSGDAMIGNILGNVNKGLNNQGQGIRNDLSSLALTKDQLQFGLDNQAREDNDAVKKMILTMRDTVSSPEAAMRYESEVGKNLPPNQRAALQDHISKTYGVNFGPLTSGATVPALTGGNAAVAAIQSAAGTAGTKEGSAYDVSYQFGKTAQPVTTMKIADVSNLQGQMIKTQGASPLGAFQINKATLEDFGPKVLGENWKEQPFSAENQEKIGEAIFNARKNGNLKETWAALPNSTPGAYKDKTWDQVRKEIAKAEVGADIPDTATMRDRKAMSAGAQSNLRNAGIVADIAKARESSATPAEVDDDLSKQPGTRDLSTKERGEAIQDIMNRTGENNPAIAGAILRRSMKAPDVEPGFIGKYIPGFTPKWQIDRQALQTNIDALRNGVTDRGESTLANVSEFQTTLEAAREDAKNKQAQVKALQTRVDNGATGLRVELESAKVRYAEAAKLADDTVKFANSSPTQNPDRVGQREAREAAARIVPQAPAPVATSTPDYVPPANSPAGKAAAKRAADAAQSAEQKAKVRMEAQLSAQAVLSSGNKEAALRLMDSSGFGTLPTDVKARISALVNQG